MQDVFEYGTSEIKKSTYILNIINGTLSNNTYTVNVDNGTLIQLNSGNAITVTVPNNTTKAYGVGTQISLLQTGVGQVSVVGASGVTLNGTGLKLRTQWSSATLIKRAQPNSWVIIGDLTV